MFHHFAPSTKLISTTGQTEIINDVVDSDMIPLFSGSIQLYDDGTHGDDFANDGVYLHSTTTTTWEDHH